MTDHEYDLVALFEECDDEDVVDIEIDEQIPEGQKINSAHTPVKAPHPKTQRKSNQNPSDESVCEAILLAVQTLTTKTDQQTEL